MHTAVFYTFLHMKATNVCINCDILDLLDNCYRDIRYVFGANCGLFTRHLILAIDTVEIVRALASGALQSYPVNAATVAVDIK